VSETFETPDQGLGPMRATISTRLVALKKEFYGKGPTGAKAFIQDEYVFAVLEGGLTRNEETLLAAGEIDVVRSYRLRFQEIMRDKLTAIVEEATGRRVLDYHSQIVFDPPRAFEIFVLDGPPGGSD
jgi:uncharacterized protein YbcI